MPQAYSTKFAHLYNRRWTDFANTVAPSLLHFYRQHPIAKGNPYVLDLCCGTGQLSLHFLQYDYRVTGLDLSHGMLQHARENCLPFVDAGQADFVQGDAANFTFKRKFGLVLSTFDALNHLPDEQALRNCFTCTAAVCEGLFIFDLNTRRGLNNWDASFIAENTEDLTLLHEGHYDETTRKATADFTAFIRQSNGSYVRLTETVFNSYFGMNDVRQWLLEAGFSKVHFARVEALGVPIEQPEMESRVWFVCER
jgi:SAM-dependent methyltransferase